MRATSKKISQFRHHVTSAAEYASGAYWAESEYRREYLLTESKEALEAAAAAIGMKLAPIEEAAQ